MRIALLILLVGLAFFGTRWWLDQRESEPTSSEAPAIPPTRGSAQITERSGPAFPAPAPAPSVDDATTAAALQSVPETITSMRVPGALPDMAHPVARPPDTKLANPPVAGGPASVPGMISAEPLQSEAASESAVKDRGWVSVRGVFTYRLPEQSAPGGTAQVNVATTIDCNNGNGVLYYRDPRQRVEWRSLPLTFELGSVCPDDPQVFQVLANTFNASLSGQYVAQRPDAGDAQVGQFGVRFVSTDTAGRPLASVEFCLALQGGPYGTYALPPSASKVAPAPGCVLLDNFWVKRMNRLERQ